jgi:type II secretory pathway pseudopilin PulG
MRMRANIDATSSNGPHAGRGEGGFTMIVTLVALVVASLLMVAAFTAANGDVHLTHTDTNAKKAYYAALAGISDYAYHLNEDVNYWTYCTTGGAASNHSLNQFGSTANRVAVPEAGEEKYAIQLLPASSSAEEKCNPANPVATMIESGVKTNGANSGTFRIQSTGYSGSQERTVVATFSNGGFLKFIYYTKYETADSVTYEPPEPKCEAFRAFRPGSCSTISFISADHLNGPVHTEDTASICNEPTFGRGPADVIEFRGGSVATGGCSNSAKYLGTLIPPAKVQSIEPPPSNNSLKSVVEPAYSYEGKTAIVLTGTTMNVTHYKEVSLPVPHVVTTTEFAVPLPPSGVIYVSNKACSQLYSPYGPEYAKDTECGNVYVSGNYTGQLTIAAENDVVINGSITTPVNSEGSPTTNAVLGLISNNFVRLYHPVGEFYNGHGSGNKECNGSDKYVGGGKCEYENTENGCDAPNLSAAEDPNGWGKLTNPTIYAAILAVNHSFIVDNFACGSPLETLTVHGAIAQIFRGTVGTHSGGVVASGYAKNYVYDDRLQYESPPYFLNPVRAPWTIRRETLAPNP